jgi:transporter family protein
LAHYSELKLFPSVPRLFDSISPNLHSLIAAVFVSVAQTLYRAGLTRLSPTATALMMNFTCAVLAAGIYFYLEGWGEQWPIEAVFWFALVGLVGGTAGRYLNFVAVKRIGLARTSILLQSLLIWTAALSVLFLGERVTPGVGLGTLAIMFGAVLLVYERDNRQEKIPLWLYLLPVLAAFMFALTFVFRRYGLALVPGPSFGLWVSTGCAAVLLLGAMPFTGESAGEVWHPRSLVFVFFGAVFNVIAALFFWTAIRDGEIVRVVPINRLSVLFVIFSSWLFFRKQEAVTLRVVLGGLLSVAGAWAIVWGK